jgi:large subunit ribosomal protein L18
MTRKDRQRRIRGKIKGTRKRPRLSVFRSLKQVYCQAIDDVKGHTLAHAQGVDPEVVGKSVADALVKQKVKIGVFDRSGYQYHGKVKVVAESLRKGGIKF